MTMLYPIVLETEESGVVSAYMPGLPVYAAADTHAKAERAIRAVLTEYLNAHPTSRPGARVRVARIADSGKRKVDIVSVAALVGANRSATKARASRESLPLAVPLCASFGHPITAQQPQAVSARYRTWCLRR
jgi:predicted RNase H-like HicB family nuclease